MCDIKDDTSGPLTRLLTLMIKGIRDERSVDVTVAAQQAETLYQAGEAKLGTDEDAFDTEGALMQLAQRVTSVEDELLGGILDRLKLIEAELADTRQRQ